MFQKLKTSGYLKTFVIVAVIFALGGGTLLGLNLYDRLTAPSAEEMVSGGGQQPIGANAEQGGGSAITIGGDTAYAEGGNRTIVVGDGESRMLPITNQDGNLQTSEAPVGSDGSVADGRAVVGGFATEEEYKTFLDEQVAAGRMTQEQADAALERYRSGERAIPSDAWAPEGQLMIPAEGEQGLTGQPGQGAAFIGGASTEEEMRAMLEKAVTEGRMTQEQADAALERFLSGEGRGAFRTGPGGGEATPPSGGTEPISDDAGGN